ncbi:MAG: hypothetical protein JO218_13440 [Burkholderiales bacterium]|nr:hypothetical protein [Burkholderiales bacterium]
MRFSYDKILFPVAMLVALVGTITVVHIMLSRAPGDDPNYQPEAPDAESLHYAAALAAWGPDIGAAQIKAFQLRWATIEHEGRVYVDNWAGVYKPRDDTRESMAIAPRGGMALVRRVDGGALLNVGLAEGKVTRTAEGLAVAYDKVLDLPDNVLPTQLYPVRWGNRHFMLDEADINALVNALNGERVFPDTLVYSLPQRAGDPDTPLKGWPDLPTSFRAHLLKAPIAGTVSVEGKRLHVNLGTKQGAFVGMPLYAVNDPTVELHVSRVDEDSCEVDNPAAGLVIISNGLVVSSRKTNAAAIKQS